MNQCLLCTLPTKNPKFCSRSCSAKYNNVLFPKRKPERTCRICSIPISGGRTFCKPCYHASRKLKYSETTTLGELKGKGNANFGGRYSYIRGHARKSFIFNKRLLKCSICRYDLHVDICHIKDIKCFSETDIIGTINHQSNLIGLCKNHHWEFDHNLL